MYDEFGSRLLFAPDAVETGGSEESTVAEEATATASEDTKESVETLPHYFSQLKKDSQEKYKSLSKYRNLDELAEAALKGDSFNEKDWLKIPKEGSTKEELRAFVTALGVPEKADDYVLPLSDKEQSPFSEALRKQVREVAYKNALSERQAQAMYGVVMAMKDTIQNEAVGEIRNKVNNFDARFEELYKKDYPDKAKRDSAMQASINNFKAFLSDTGLGDVMKDDYSLYNEKLVKGIADYVAKQNGAGYVAGRTSTPNSGTKNKGSIQYGDQFSNAYGGGN